MLDHQQIALFDARHLVSEISFLILAHRFSRVSLSSSRGQAPEYISNMLKTAAHDPSLTTLRTAANGNYVVVCTNRRLGDRAFSVAAPKAWNSLPTDLKTAICSTDAFKRRLKI